MNERSDMHTTVLLREAVDALALKEGATAIDATLGSGGHYAQILENVGEMGTVLGIDADPVAVERAQVRFATHANARFAVGNFRNVAALAEREGLRDVDGILADLGWRMEQFSHDPLLGGGKGFSFQHDEPLAMTFGDPATYAFTAADIVNEWKEQDIVNVLKAYGEERYAKGIARAIGEYRETKRIETASELASIIYDAVPGAYRRGRIHPATKTFQALRIAVNDELDALADFIHGALATLKSGGRLAIISFHSIEDRIAKHTLRALEDEGRVRRITKKPITPSAEELHANSRARSAKLRIIEKT